MFAVNHNREPTMNAHLLLGVVTIIHPLNSGDQCYKRAMCAAALGDAAFFSKLLRMLVTCIKKSTDFILMLSQKQCIDTLKS